MAQPWLSLHKAVGKACPVRGSSVEDADCGGAAAAVAEVRAGRSGASIAVVGVNADCGGASVAAAAVSADCGGASVTDVAVEADCRDVAAAAVVMEAIGSGDGRRDARSSGLGHTHGDAVGGVDG